MPNMPSVLTGALKKPFAEQVAYFRNKMGNLIPTQRWNDVKGVTHDIGFMVAGAQKADLLADLAAAVDRSITEGKSLQAFRKDFFNLVEQRGWHNYTGSETEKGRAWRTRIIYQTNMTTSYAAARRAQLTEADFDLWVYKHGGSKNPREQHLAWDGLTLPKDHPFWETHYPPADNAYGCSCYVVGARSEKGAKRLGANLDKTLPDNWKPAEASTGYPLGKQVANTVQVMAEKTRQWEYELAKAYMQGVPETVRDQLAQSYRGLPSVATDVKNYASRVLDKAKNVEIQPYRTMGLLTSADVAQIKQLAEVDVTGFDFALDASSVRHAFDHHGDEKVEAKRGQRAVTASDYAYLPLLLSSPDEVSKVGVTDNNQPLLHYQKEINGEKYQAVFGARRKRKMMALKTFYIGAKK